MSASHEAARASAPAPAPPRPRSALNRDRLSALFVLNSLSVGGSETKTVRIVNQLLDRQMRAGVAYLDRREDLRWALAPEAPVWDLQRRGKFSLSSLQRLRRVIREQQPALVLAVNLYPSLYASLACIGLSAPPRTLALLNTSVLSRRNQWRQRFYQPFLRRLDGLVYGCELQRSAWDAALGSPSNRSSVIYNGVDVDHFAPPDEARRLAARRALGAPADGFVVGAVGRLAPEKNQIVLIDALLELRKRSIEAHLILVGDGALRGALEQHAAALGLRECVTFAGKQRDVRDAVAAMDVFVLPSTHVETFSNAALEAMAMRKPVILSRIGGAVEMVDEGVEGYTVEPIELSRVLPALLVRLHEDRALRERLGRAARQRVIQQFSLQSMTERYASLVIDAAGRESK